MRFQRVETLAGKLKHEVRRETMAIAFNSFIEAKRGNPIDFCQFAIQDDPDAADSAAQRAALTIEVRIAEAFPEDQPS